MKIVEPKSEIIEDELSQLSIYQRIAYCAGVCYQREPRKTEEEAQAFCRSMVERGHLTTLEMAVVHLAIPYDMADIYSGEKFLTVTAQWNNPKAIVTGSIRAWLEVEGEYGSSVWDFLAEQYPLFFRRSCSPNGQVRLARPNEIPWQHKNVAVRFIVNRAVSHELVRHRPVSYLQECLSGDTEVKAFSGRKKWTMKELHRLFNTPSCGIARAKIRVRTMTKDKEIVSARILSVVESGSKEVWCVKTSNGRSVKASKNHIFFSEHGQVRLKDLTVGDNIYMNGATITKDWLKQEYLVKNRQRIDIANEIGMSDSWLGKQIYKWGLQKPKPMYPNRKPGHGNPGMHSDRGRKDISMRMMGENNPSWKGDDITEHGARGRLHRHSTVDGKNCICGSPAKEMHHTDRNPKNNDEKNIEFVCAKCHKARHFDAVTIAWLDTIVSIEPCGVEMTYDLEVDRPEHNFSANGFIVHNSQRYCRYEDEVVFIRPEWWNNGYTRSESDWKFHTETSELRYRRMLEEGLKPQQARAVLPNSTKTELIAYASLPQWKHMFNLRCSPAADPEMRRVMIPLREEFKMKYPEMWEGE